MVSTAGTDCNYDVQAGQPGDGWVDPRERGGLPIFAAGDLVVVFPSLRPVLIDGLLRQGETMNLIAASKIGKSWMTYLLAFSVALGNRFLDSFATTQGDVLIIDNELHPETIAHRLRTVASALGIPLEEVAERIHIVSLRGRLQDLHKLTPSLMALEPGRFKVVIVDAFYRALPTGTDENNNAEIAYLYNVVDSIADKLGCSFVFVHHASKGDQSAKAVTDVGSGAGSQSRATDTHLILRPHEEAGAVVLDAAVRSFAPVDPVCLRWNYPTWTPAPDLDPTRLRNPRSRRNAKPDESERKSEKTIWSADKFAATFGTAEPKPKSVVLDEAAVAGISDRKIKQLLDAALDRGLLHAWKDPAKGGRTVIGTERPPETPENPEKTRVNRARRQPK